MMFVKCNPFRADTGRSALPHSVSSGARVFVILIAVGGKKFRCAELLFSPRRPSAQTETSPEDRGEGNRMKQKRDGRLRDGPGSVPSDGCSAVNQGSGKSPGPEHPDESLLGQQVKAEKRRSQPC